MRLFVCGAHPRTGYADPDHPAGHDQDRQSLCPGGGVSGGRCGGDPEPAGKQLCRLAACGAAGASLWRAAAAAGRRSGTALCVYGKRDHRIGSGGPAGTGSVRTGAGTACSRPGRPGFGGRAAGRLCLALPGGRAGRCTRQGQRDQHRAQSRADHAGTACLPPETA